MKNCAIWESPLFSQSVINLFKTESSGVFFSIIHWNLRRTNSYNLFKPVRSIFSAAGRSTGNGMYGTLQSRRKAFRSCPVCNARQVAPSWDATVQVLKGRSRKRTSPHWVSLLVALRHWKAKTADEPVNVELSAKRSALFSKLYVWISKNVIEDHKGRMSKFTIILTLCDLPQPSFLSGKKQVGASLVGNISACKEQHMPIAQFKTRAKHGYSS